MIEEKNMIDTSEEGEANVPEVDVLDGEGAADEVGDTDAGSFAVDSSESLLPVEPKSIDRPMLKKIIQGALLAAAMPLSVEKLRSLFDPQVDIEPEPRDIVALLEEIAAECGESGFELVEVGTGWRYQVRAETAPWVNRLWEEKPQRYSRALLETLSLIAYRQPITRGDIEEIRGVAVSSHIIKTLTEREWVKVVGHRDVPGRPSLYATTRQFLDYFNLKSLDELPSLSEIADFDKLTPELDLALGFGPETQPESNEVDDSNDEELEAGPSEDGAEIELDAAEAFMTAVAEEQNEMESRPSSSEKEEGVTDLHSEESTYTEESSLDDEGPANEYGADSDTVLDAEGDDGEEESFVTGKVLPSLFDN